MPDAPDNPRHRAARFVQSLAPAAAEAMLTRLSADEARSLREAIRELGGSPASEAASEESLGDTVEQPGMQHVEAGGVELQLSTTTVVEEHTPLIAEPTPAEVPDPADWLASLEDADPAAIAAFVVTEQPAAVALVLGHLPAKLAGRVLAHLSDEARPRVVERLASQGDPDPEAVRMIAAGLSDWIAQQERQSQERNARVARLRGILDATPARDRGGLLATLREAEPEIAAELVGPSAGHRSEARVTRSAYDLIDQAEALPRERPTSTQVTSPLPLDAEQLGRLDPRALVAALGRLDGRTALLALAGAPDVVYRRVTSGMRGSAVKDLERRLTALGPTALVDIDRAGRALADTAAAVVASRRPARSLTREA